MSKRLITLFFLLSLNLHSQSKDTDPMPYSFDDKHYGYASYLWNIDETWEVVISPKFEAAYSFNGGLARVKEFGKFGYIDVNGDYVIAPVYDYAGDFFNGKALVVQGNDSFYINTKGELYINTSVRLIEHEEYALKACDLKLENMKYYPYYDPSKDDITIFRIRLFR